MDQDATWHGVTKVNLGPGHVALDGVAARPPPLKGAQPSVFGSCLYCGQTAGRMKTPLGTEADLGPGHIVLDRDTADPPFQPMTIVATVAHLSYC